ncbi:zinc ribbon domain-containing protein [Legionella israelensis]|uniref:Zinc ribbon domain-containing protein n=1 Tax=Legionella israelensis TaxID=454 RepID=A0AAX1EH47_9GAMM|nr:zinc ribbon domain-containing protein [Legionella israelensis]QBR84192.1 zinc ribbon domain-containing protein [Legionella israelensis]
MPIYEYQCTSCHHQFELMQKVSDPPAKQCPVCYENHVIRLVSPAGFQLKGSGWYVTDFKNKGKPESKAQENKKEEKGKSEETSKKDMKTTESNKTAKNKGEKD